MSPQKPGLPGPNDRTPCSWHALPSGVPLRIVLEPRPAQGDADAGAVEHEWGRIRATNPRAFNGPILHFLGADPVSACIRAAREEYMRLAVQPVLETGVVQLGVTGILEASDALGRRHVLLGLRSNATRVFGGMWEFGPSGGVDPPPVGETSMDADDVWRVLIEEIREEVGLPVDPDPSPPIALLRDPIGRSVELIVRVGLRRPVEELIALIDGENRTSRWEYDAVRWVASDEVHEFVRREPSIPTAVVIADRLAGSGLVDGEG